MCFHTLQGSELSAEAESFVPSHLKNPTTTAQQSGMEGGGSGSRPETPTDLPHYVTNCYPFVSQDNTDSAIRYGQKLVKLLYIANYMGDLEVLAS